MFTRRLLLSLLVTAPTAQALLAQEAVKVGGGSYAATPPTYKSRTADHGGSYATMMQTRELYIDEALNGVKRPIPTNDWWTDLLNHQYADALWSYPQMLKPSEEGVTVNYPTYWIDNGTEVKSRSWLRIGGKAYKATSAIAADWHDWDVVMRLPGRKGEEMRVTMAHGIPFTWFEFDSMTPRVEFSATPSFYDENGEEISSYLLNNRTLSMLGIRIGDDLYALYLPKNASITYSDGTLTLDNADYCVTALLRNTDDIKEYARWAYSIPRSTQVSWSYNQSSATLTTEWQVTAENLLTPGAAAPVLQGFLPHMYKHSLENAPFTDIEYLTPRGQLKIAEPTDSNKFSFSMRFAGIMPHYAAPAAGDYADHPYSQQRMDALMESYAEDGAFGSDTYWGGKGLIQMAMNMTFALETGNPDCYETSRQKLREVMENWLTYTPGEDNYFFAYYPRWGGMLGYEYSYDSDLFNDHHFHYGYMLYAGALLCMHDAEFKAEYGEMLRLIAKDFANWEHEDSRFPFLRTLDPWVGHSYAGGLGDGANDNGNGQESSSEAMQGWGGVYLLGVALGDDAMRNAGIFGWLTESNGVAEYWFDRDHIYTDRTANYDYTLYDHPYNTNITSKGIGWWTWFSGDPLWMHSIQWMPVSPCLNYLSQDLNFVKWDYETFEESTAYKWFEQAARDSETLEPLANQSVGNVVLSYLERYNPKRAAEIFDTAWDSNMPLAKSIDTGHISYYVMHSHLRWGDPDYSVYASIPTANAYKREDGSMVYMVYNPTGEEQTVSFYRDNALLARWKAPVSDKILCFTDAAEAASLSLADETGEKEIYLAPGVSTYIIATLIDNYGASMEAVTPTYTLPENCGATISSEGTLQALSDTAVGTEITLQAAYSDFEAEIKVIIGEKPVLAEGEITPVLPLLEVGNSVEFSLNGKDQYGNTITPDASWLILNAEGETVSTEARFTPDTPGKYSIEAVCDGKSISRELVVTPTLPNLALGCTAYSSSEENAGCLTSNATDGDTSTRWGSAHTDDEWIYVDLGKTCIVSGVSILWEAAYAASYAIETATEENPDVWDTAKTVTGRSSAGEDREAINATCRYVRIRGLKRGTAYGYSLYELRVHGVPADADADFVTGLYVPMAALIEEDQTYTLTANLCRLDGSMTPTEATWSCDGSAELTGNQFTPRDFGTMTLTATTDEYTAEVSTLVAESIKLHHIEVSPTEATILLGESVTITAKAYNQFDGIWSGDFSSETSIYDITDAEQPVLSNDASYDSETGIFTSKKRGVYSLQFADGTTSTITVQAINEANLALNKSATASTTRDGNSAAKAVDGNSGTRWESDWSDDQWLMVDLEEAFNINRIEISWEGAYASSYQIEASLDGESWSSIYSETAGNGGKESISFNATPAQFVRINCLTRGTGYGNSIYEFEVYGESRYNNPTTDLNAIGSDAEQKVDIYSLQGILLRKGVTRAEGMATLPAGIYIVGGEKWIKR